MIDTTFCGGGIHGLRHPITSTPSAAPTAQPSDTFVKSEAPSTRDVIARFPKVDLHRHLEGSISPESFLKLADKYGITLPTHDLEELRPYLQVTAEDKTLLDFLEKFNTIGLAFTCKEAIVDITKAVIEDAAKDNIKYLELRFSPMYMAATKNLDLHEVMDAVVKGTNEASAETGTRTNLIVIVERQMGPEKAKIAQKLAEEYKDRGVVALDLANDEYNYPPGPYAAVFQEAKANGLKITVHAGEAGGADNVRTAIEQLGADRIGHGVRTQEDPAVEQLVLDRKIPLEFNPTSNIQTGATSSFDNYPLKRYHVKGIPITINTDDPAVSGITLSHEYEVAVDKLGLSFDDLEQIVMQGVDAAFLPDGEKKAMAERFAADFRDIDEWRMAQK